MYERLRALCRLLEDSGDMTPTATRQILRTIVSVEIAEREDA